MKVSELNEIVQFFESRQDNDEQKAEYYKMKLQAEQLRLLSEVRVGINQLHADIVTMNDNVVEAIVSRLWPLLTTYEFTEDQTEENEEMAVEGEQDDEAAGTE